jgi:predicted RNase H-like HicB family nuclease
MKRKTLKKKVYQYTAIFEPDIKLGGYTVTIPVLPGCISEGDSFEDALNNIQEAAILYLSVMRQEKEEIPAEGAGIIMAPIQVKA